MRRRTRREIKVIIMINEGKRVVEEEKGKENGKTGAERRDEE